ncbi:hypothetical protein HBI91_029210 [Parastagonospora nodorum]|nr:hypothetical protein HBI91_029210 [Parastagonospora nodorum]
MNVVGKFKEKHRRAKEESEDQKKLEAIPISRINGIGALPVELWSIILEHVVTSQLSPSSVQCWTMSDMLDQRLVCHVFSKEIPHSLHQHILLPQLPRLLIMRTLLHSPQSTHPPSLLASAIYNSTRTLPKYHQHFTHATPRIARRIRNCSIIASHISHPPFTPSLLQRLSTAASTSIYVQEYIFMPSYYEQLFASTAEGDACLEVALLSVCGYEMEDVIKTMVRLVGKGDLEKYVWGRYAWEVRRERRWMKGVGERKYGRMDISCIGGEGSVLW